MKRKITTAVLIVTIVSIITTAIFLYQQHKTDVQTFVGEVIFVRGYPADEYERCFAYLRSVTDSTREDLVIFEITSETVFASGYINGRLKNAPELVEGSFIEINFDKNGLNNCQENYKAISVGVANSESTSTDELSPLLDEDYSFDNGSLGMTIYGEIVYIANCELPSLSGYIVYIEEYQGYPLKAIWVCDKTSIDGKAKSILEEKKTGDRVEAKLINQSPFEFSTNDVRTAFNLIAVSD